MQQLSRCEFLALSAAAVAVPGKIFVFAEDVLGHPRKAVEVLERARVLSAADRYLQEPPKTIVSSPASQSAVGPHNYFLKQTSDPGRKERDEGKMEQAVACSIINPIPPSNLRLQT